MLGWVRQGREEVKAPFGPRALVAPEAGELDQVPRPVGDRVRFTSGGLGGGPGACRGPQDEEREELERGHDG